MVRHETCGSSEFPSANLKMMCVPTKTSSTTIGFSRTVRPDVPQPDASTGEKKEFLEEQLDSLKGHEVLGGFRLLPGLSNRFIGGTHAMQ